MSTPVIAFRAKPERHRALREIVNTIKDDPRRLRATQAFLRDAPSGSAIGPFASEAAALSFLVGRLTTAHQPEAIYLFGSRATGTARPDSDFDLLLVLSDQSPPLGHYAAYAPIAGSGLGVDVVPCFLADFLRERTEEGTLPWSASARGRALYLRPSGRLRQE
ncbi:MAG: nucleotidyltransferase domain-containing protein [Alphaproteobacteria bacterium]|nr:nucleotidyltransferase domain-containing protein [Alphaproteobacteria bacterium]